jgi:hypothetical protein
VFPVWRCLHSTAHIVFYSMQVSTAHLAYCAEADALVAWQETADKGTVWQRLDACQQNMLHGTSLQVTR